jgi:gluconate 2-dehydrogenase gamma chain
MFFTNELDFSTLSAASERIFPKDETGPGAVELSVPFFIDNQLAGAFGYNAREYMTGPFFTGAPTQGYQTSLLKKDIFLQGIAALNRQSDTMFKKNFPFLSDFEKDQILKLCETGSIPTEGFTSSYFFALLKSTVFAGVYADPIYSGNADMNGWRMKRYPGAQMTYRDIIESGKFENIAPVSLADMY